MMNFLVILLGIYASYFLGSYSMNLVDILFVLSTLEPDKTQHVAFESVYTGLTN